MTRASLALVAAMNVACAYVHGGLRVEGAGGRVEMRPDRCSILDGGTRLTLSSREDPLWMFEVQHELPASRATSVLTTWESFSLDLVDLRVGDGSVLQLRSAQCRRLMFSAEHNAFTVRINGGAVRTYYGGRLDVDCDAPSHDRRLVGHVTFNYCSSL